MNPDKNYTNIADLLTDDSFLAWYFAADKQYGAAWSRWMAGNAKHAQLADSAVQLLSLIKCLEPEELPASEINAAFDRLLKKIIEREKQA